MRQSRKIGQRLVEYVGGQVLGHIAVVDATCGEGIHALKIVLVMLSEPGGVFLGSLHQEAFSRLRPRPLRCILFRRAPAVYRTVALSFAGEGGDLTAQPHWHLQVSENKNQDGGVR